MTQELFVVYFSASGVTRTAAEKLTARGRNSTGGFCIVYIYLLILSENIHSET